MESGNFLDILALASLFNDDSDNECDLENATSRKRQIITPGTIGQGHVGSQGKLSDEATNTSRNVGTIWSSTEIENSANTLKIPDISNDPRQRPEVQVHFKQDVTTEDVFLGSVNANPSSTSCEWLLVNIQMPGENDCAKFQLDLKENWIELRSPIYVLVYVLPHPINPRLGNAKWNRDTDTLTLTLKIARDWDAFNTGLF